jgi:hypothetical protein
VVRARFELPVPRRAADIEDLGAIVEISALTVLDARQDFALGGGVALELVRYDYRGTYCKSFSSLRKNR